jgi:hypothetical protein
MNGPAHRFSDTLRISFSASVVSAMASTSTRLAAHDRTE